MTMAGGENADCLGDTNTVPLVGLMLVGGAPGYPLHGGTNGGKPTLSIRLG